MQKPTEKDLKTFIKWLKAEKFNRYNIKNRKRLLIVKVSLLKKLENKGFDWNEKI